jgi:hypothetical protein
MRRLLIAALVAVSLTVGVPMTPLTPTAHAAEDMFFVCDDPTLLAIWNANGYADVESYATVVCPEEFMHAADMYIVWCYNEDPNFACGLGWWAWLYRVVGGIPD